MNVHSEQPHEEPGFDYETDLAESAIAQRRAGADNVVKNHVMLSMSLGLIPVPIFDLAGLIGNQVKMVHGLCGLYEIDFKEHRAKSIIAALISGTAPVAGVVGLSSGLKLLPGIGTLAGSGAVSLVGGALTYALGQVFIHHFETGGTLLDLDVAKLRNYFRAQFKAGKSVAAATAQTAAPAE